MCELALVCCLRKEAGPQVMATFLGVMGDAVLVSGQEMGSPSGRGGNMFHLDLPGLRLRTLQSPVVHKKIWSTDITLQH